MRIAVIADIHGNLGALEAVIEDLDRTKPDLVVNLGDCLSGPLQAGATADLLMTKNWLTIRGNHDRYLIETPIEKLKPSDREAAEQMDERHFDWLRALPFSLTPAEGVMMFHAQPERDDDYLTERPTFHGHEVLPDAIVSETLAGITAALVLCAHSHIPRLMELSDRKTVFNPGSVGLPAYDDDHPTWHFMQAESQHARYGLAERGRAGWDFTFRALRYDWKAAADLALSKGRRDWAHALSSGLALKAE
jgi:predicted phosphodiesterase